MLSILLCASAFFWRREIAFSRASSSDLFFAASSPESARSSPSSAASSASMSLHFIEKPTFSCSIFFFVSRSSSSRFDHPASSPSMRTIFVLWFSILFSSRARSFSTAAPSPSSFERRCRFSSISPSVSLIAAYSSSLFLLLSSSACFALSNSAAASAYICPVFFASALFASIISSRALISIPLSSSRRSRNLIAFSLCLRSGSTRSVSSERMSRTRVKLSSVCASLRSASFFL